MATSPSRSGAKSGRSSSQTWRGTEPDSRYALELPKDSQVGDNFGGANTKTLMRITTDPEVTRVKPCIRDLCVTIGTFVRLVAAHSSPHPYPAGIVTRVARLSSRSMRLS